MDRKKRWLFIAIALLAVVLIVAGCAANNSNDDGQALHGNNDDLVNDVGDVDGIQNGEDANNEADDEGVDDHQGLNDDEPQGHEGSDQADQPADQADVRSVQMDIPSMYEEFEEYFPIGAAIEPHQTQGLFAELLKKHVNMIVAENVMKPENIQPREGEFRWEQADRIVNFAKENGMELRYHTLVWHNQVPQWFFLDEDGKRMVNETDPDKREANKALLLERLETHVKTIVERYKDDIKSWDVVNEVIDESQPDGMRKSEWYQITGTDYIETAFRAAREAGGPDLRLYINDYSTEEAPKRDVMYDFVKEMLERGVPIDGVGHQLHISIEYPPARNIIASLQKFAELGLDNIITELDMSVYAWQNRGDYGDDIPADILLKQRTQYDLLFRALRDHSDILSEVVFWGISDAHTWKHDFPVNGRTDAPLPFDKNFQAKPAFWGIIGQRMP